MNSHQNAHKTTKQTKKDKKGQKKLAWTEKIVRMRSTSSGKPREGKYRKY